MSLPMLGPIPFVPNHYFPCVVSQVAARQRDGPALTVFLKERLLVKQTDLHRAIARVTGESVRHISRLGFSLLVMPGPARSCRKKRRHCGSADPSAGRGPIVLPSCQPA